MTFPAWPNRHAGGFPRTELSQLSGDRDVGFCPRSTGDTQSQTPMKPPGPAWAHPPARFGAFPPPPAASLGFSWDLECAASSVLCSASLDGDTRCSDRTLGKVILALLFILSDFCHVCFQIIPHTIGILLLTKFILGGFTQFCFSTLHSHQSSPLLQIPQSKFICDTLKFHLRAAAGTQKKYPKHRTTVRGGVSSGMVGWEKKSLENGRLNLERVFWTPCTGVISAADNKEIHFVVLRKIEFIFPKQLSWQMLQLYLKCQAGIIASK